MKTMQEWWRDLKEHGAVWQHPGNCQAPHVVLRSGKHSDGFIDTLQFLSVVVNLNLAAHALSEQVRRELTSQRIDWVFGSPMAGIPLATAAAPFLGAGRVGFTEKKGDKELICRFEIPPSARVLLIEEMTTTGGTPQRGIDAILAKNPDAEVIPLVGAFLTRCGTRSKELHSAELVPVVDFLGVYWNQIVAELREWSKMMALVKALNNEFVLA